MVVNKPLYVIDASIILKWVLYEVEDQPQSLLIKEDYLSGKINLAIPQYAYAEVLNILGRERTHDETMALFSFLLTFKMSDYPLTLGLASLAIKLMKSFSKVSFYDAGYHALALQEGGTFITADKKYFQITARGGNIMLLKDYGRSR